MQNIERKPCTLSRGRPKMLERIVPVLRQFYWKRISFGTDKGVDSLFVNYSQVGDQRIDVFGMLRFQSSQNDMMKVPENEHRVR